MNICFCSLNLPGYNWIVKLHDCVLATSDYDEIQKLAPAVFSNDLTGIDWCFDTKLSSGSWLENIELHGNTFVGHVYG